MVYDNKIKFAQVVDKTWHEVSFGNLFPCTMYTFKIEALYHVIDEATNVSNDIRSSPTSITAKTACVPKITTESASTLEYAHSSSEMEETTTEVYVSTSILPPIEAISGVYTEQIVQV